VERATDEFRQQRESKACSVFAPSHFTALAVPIVYPISLTPNPPMATSRKLFVNVVVADLTKSTAFFTALGFTFNPKFTDDNAACMVVNDEAYFMLLTEQFFRTFSKKEPCDTTRTTEALFALSCESRAEVDELVAKALAAGGAPDVPAKDHGFMYEHSFFDLDGHGWGVFWMDPATIQ
jgi:predicted lactoylglutathione lyase